MASLGLALALLMTLAGSVAAAAPVNDNRAGATVVASLPFLEQLDTSEATVEADDPDCWDGEKPVSATVWYSFTPAADGTYGVTTAGSSYLGAVLVGIPTGDGTIDIDRCGWVSNKVPGVSWRGTAGQPYLIMVAAWGQAGGALVVQVVQDPPTVRFPKFTIFGDGELWRQKGAEIRGRLTCRNAVARPQVSVNVSQRLPGRPKVEAYGWTVARCGQEWKAVALTNRAFRPGKVTLWATVGAYNDYDWEQRDEKSTVTLK